MSKEVAKQIVKKAKEDPKFMKSLLSNPDATLQSYDLTEQEKNFFRTADQKTLEGLSDSCFEIGEGKKKKKQ